MNAVTPKASGQDPASKPARLRPLVVAALAFLLATVAVTYGLWNDEDRREARALDVVKADALATWMPDEAQERRRSYRTVGTVQGIPARGVVERDLALSEEALESTFAAAVAAAEAAGYTLRDDINVGPDLEGQWRAYLSQHSPCRCEAQIAASTAVATTDPRGRFVGLSIRITGMPGD